MKKYFIGELIKKRRVELKLTQEQLCQGICEPITISRLENGRQTPSINTLCFLLERLGLPDDKYYALLSKNEMYIDNLKSEIVSANALMDSERGLPKIEELEKLIDADDHPLHQFIISSKVLLGKCENGKIVAYSSDEKLDMLFNAIQLTTPNFDIDEIYKGLYSIDEVKVINQIASVYSDLGQNKKAIDIYYQLLRYITKHFQNIFQSEGLLPMVAFHYARELTIAERYEEALEIAETGWKACTQYGQYRYLPSTISIMAECYHFLNQDEKSKIYYKQAFYIFEAINNNRDAEFIKAKAKKYFGNNFSF